MNCPICGCIAIKDNPQTPNGGQLFVAEEFHGDSCSCYAPDITGYTCSADKHHMFYIVEEKHET